MRVDHATFFKLSLHSTSPNFFSRVTQSARVIIRVIRLRGVIWLVRVITVTRNCSVIRVIRFLNLLRFIGLQE